MTAVHAALIEHRHGSNLYLGETQETLDAQLDAFVCEWWHELPYREEMLDEPAERIRVYFETHPDEHLTRFGETEVL